MGARMNQLVKLLTGRFRQSRRKPDGERGQLACRSVYQAIASRSPESLKSGLGSLTFESDGRLLEGVYRLNWMEFVTAYGFNEHRIELIGKLKYLVNILVKSGCKRVILGGSLVTRAEHPRDFDGCFDEREVDSALIAGLEPALLIEETADIHTLHNKYGGVLEPQRIIPSLGVTMVEILKYDSRTGMPKGVVSLELSPESPEFKGV